MKESVQGLHSLLRLKIKTNVQLLLGILGSPQALLVSKKLLWGLSKPTPSPVGGHNFPVVSMGFWGCFLRMVVENPPFQKRSFLGKTENVSMGQLGKTKKKSETPITVMFIMTCLL